MRIIGLVCFYDESPGSLVACLTGLRTAGVSHVVAVDGAYALYPGGRPASPSDQLGALVIAAAQLGMGITLHVPQGLWANNEIEKRTFMFEMALPLSDPTDWLLVMDSDQVIENVPDDFHERLVNSEQDVAEVNFFENDAVYTRRILFRAQPIFLRNNHFTYVTIDGRVLWAEDQTPQETPLELHDFVVRHNSANRPAAREEAKREYYRTRDREKAELVKCGLCGEAATKRMPTNWRRRKGQVVAQWVEVCDRCGDGVDRVNRVRLESLGMDPDQVVVRHAYGRID